MNLEQLNNILQNLAQQPTRENVLEFSFALIEWMGLEPNAGKSPQLIAPKTQKLREYLTTAPQTVQPQLYRLTADSQPVRVRFAVLKKIKKEYINQLVDNDPGPESYQNTPDPLKAVTKAPYFIHFVTTADYDKIILLFNQADQKKIIILRNRLTNTQYLKIIQKWQFIALKPKAEIASLFWKSLDLNEVNKEFYIKIKERFDALLGILSNQKPEVIEKDLKMFSIRLIGRYIFCWFLKEKEIISGELIGSEALQRYESRYNRILKPLFFETLNTYPYPIRTYSSDLPKELIKHLNDIPYLNGGLFEPSVEDKMFPNVSIDDWLLSFVHLLEQYSFTVDESSPTYEQVAIDPEMLGKILENLLASLNPETEKLANERNALGAFYTPRPIVDYMVSESLKIYFESQLLNDNTEVQAEDFIKPKSNTVSLFSALEPKQLMLDVDKIQDHSEAKVKLRSKIEKLFDVAFEQNPFNAAETKKIKEALNEVKIIDPACGSGAFPMGVLHKLEMLHERLGTDKSSYELRRKILSQNIFGVDILPMAVEISRLRAWLALVLVSEYKKADKKHNFNIKALPNLDFKFVCANTLVSVPENEYVDLMAAADLKLFEELTEKYFSSNTDEKEQLKSEIQLCIDNITSNHERAIERYVVELRKHQNSASASKMKQMRKELNVYEKQKKQWHSYKKMFSHGSVDFFDKKYFFPSVKSGFDIVIGNPPYIQLQDKSKLPDELLKTYEEQKFETFDNTGDIYCLFYEKGCHLLKKGGVLFYISSNKWMRANYGKKLRHYLVHHTNPVFLFDFSWYQVFENASVDSNLLAFTKQPYRYNTFSVIAKQDFSIFNLKSYVDKNVIVKSFPDNNYWAISDYGIEDLKSKFVKLGVPLVDWDLKIFRGILTGLNDVLIIDKEKKEELISLDPRNSDLIKPLLRGRDVERYGYTFQNLFLINSHNGIKEKGIKPINVKKDYPTIYKYLFDYKSELQKRSDKGDEWYNLRNCAYLEEFNSEKLIWAETMRIHKTGDRNFPRFGYDSEGFYTDKTVFIGVGSHLKYLLAILNSKIGKWLIMEYVTKLDTGGYMMQKTYLDKIPILVPTSQQEKEVNDLVNQILKFQKSNKRSDELEKKIDMLFYQYYQLTFEEMKIIDPTMKEAEFQKAKIQ